MTDTPVSTQRIDKWLFFARVVKSRALAAKLVSGGGVRVGGEKIGKASYGVKSGDVLTIAVARKVLIYKVVDLGTRRGPASEAVTLYENLTPAPVKKEPKPVPLFGAREAGTGRPVKRERRKLDALRAGKKD